jgi:hypothetical protein
VKTAREGRHVKSMSLSMELALAFGRRGPLASTRRSRSGGPLIGGTQEDAEEAAKPDTGFGWNRVDFAVVINAGGEIVDIERPPWHPRGRARHSSMMVPIRQLRTQDGVSGFLWGASAHALGLRRWGPDGEIEATPEAFHSFRAFHRVALANARDHSLRAFLAFLDNWRPEWAFQMSELTPLVGGSLAFRFLYDDSFLHEGHTARLIWSRLLGTATDGDEPTEVA